MCPLSRVSAMGWALFGRRKILDSASGLAANGVAGPTSTYVRVDGGGMSLDVIGGSDTLLRR